MTDGKKSKLGSQDENKKGEPQTIVVDPSRNQTAPSKAATQNIQNMIPDQSEYEPNKRSTLSGQYESTSKDAQNNEHEVLASDSVHAGAKDGRNSKNSNNASRQSRRDVIKVNKSQKSNVHANLVNLPNNRDETFGHKQDLSPTTPAHPEELQGIYDDIQASRKASADAGQETFNIQQMKEVRFSQLQNNLQGHLNIKAGDIGNFKDLTTAQKLAMTQQRKTVPNNNIRVLEQKQTYNPYHLSSYNQITSDQTTSPTQIQGRQAGSFHIQNHNEEGPSNLELQTQFHQQQTLKSFQGSPTNAVTTAMYDSQRIYQQKKATVGQYANEARRQHKKKQEIEQINRTSVSKAQRLKAGFTGATFSDGGKNQQRARMGPRNRTAGGLGIRGERAMMVRTSNFGMLAKEQMGEIEKMQEQIKENLSNLQKQKKVLQSNDMLMQQHSSLGPRNIQYQLRTVYRMDPNYGTDLVVIPGADKVAGRPINSSPPAFRKSPMQPRGRAKGSAPGGTRDSARQGASVSQQSSQQRREAAANALESFVIREELSKKVLDYADGRDNNYTITNGLNDGNATKLAPPGSPDDYAESKGRAEKSIEASQQPREQSPPLQGKLGQEAVIFGPGRHNSSIQDQTTLKHPSGNIDQLMGGRISHMTKPINFQDTQVIDAQSHQQHAQRNQQVGHPDRKGSTSSGPRNSQNALSKSQNSQRFAIYSAYQNKGQRSPGNQVVSQRIYNSGAEEIGIMQGVAIGNQGNAPQSRQSVRNESRNKKHRNESKYQFLKQNSTDPAASNIKIPSMPMNVTSHDAAPKTLKGSQEIGSADLNADFGFPDQAAHQELGQESTETRVQRAATSALHDLKATDPSVLKNPAQPDTIDREGEQISKEMQLLERSFDVPVPSEAKTRNHDTNTVKTKNLDESLSQVDQAPLQAYSQPASHLRNLPRTAIVDTDASIRLQDGQDSVYLQDAMHVVGRNVATSETKRGESQRQTQLGQAVSSLAQQQQFNRNATLENVVTFDAQLVMQQAQIAASAVEPFLVLGSNILNTRNNQITSSNPKSNVQQSGGGIPQFGSQLDQHMAQQAAIQSVVNQGQRRQTAPTGFAAQRKRRMGAMQQNMNESPSRQYDRDAFNRSCEDPAQILAMQTNTADALSHDFAAIRDDPNTMIQNALNDAETRQRRKKVLRNHLDHCDRKSFNFIPRPAQVGLKFKNLSEQQRFLKLSGLIMKIDEMNNMQAEQLKLRIKRYLLEWQIHFGFTGTHTDNVSDRMVSKFIRAVQQLNEAEQLDFQNEYRSMNESASKKQHRGRDVVSQPAPTDLKTDSIFGKINVQISDYADPLHSSMAPDNYVRDGVNSKGTSRIEHTMPSQQTALKNPKAKMHFFNFMRQVYGFSIIERPQVASQTQQSVLSGVQSADGTSLSPSQMYGNVDRDFATTFGLKQERPCRTSYQPPGDEEEGDDPEKWTKQSLWPQEVWTMNHKEIDLTTQSQFDGLRREKCKELEIPVNVDSRNEELISYIQNHSKTNKHETMLPCILNGHYYKGKQNNAIDHKILSRLRQKQLQKSMPSRGAISLNQDVFMKYQASVGGGSSSLYKKGSRYDDIVGASESVNVILRSVDQTRTGTAAVQPKNFQKNLKIMTSNSKMKMPKQIRRFTNPAGLAHTQNVVDFTTNALQKESMIRRNELTLEHIMHERGKTFVDDRISAQLHMELRRMENRERKTSEIIVVSRK